MIKKVMLGVIVSFVIISLNADDNSALKLSNTVDISISKSDILGEFEATANIIYDKNFTPLKQSPTVLFKVENSERKTIQTVKCKLLEKVKLKIPKKGVITLFCEVLTDKLSVIGQRTVIFKNGIPINSKSDDADPVIITIAPFCDFTRCPQTTNQVMHIRSKVIANLIQNYNVIVLNRSNSISFADEEKLNAVNELNKKEVNHQGLLGADTALTGYFNIARKTAGHSSNVDLGTVLFISDLKNKGEANYKKIEFIPYEPTLFDGDITKEIVKALKLKPKKTTNLPLETQQLDETWAVMPIIRLETEATMNAPADTNLAMEIELALQESGRVKRIVDHSELEKVLEELKLSSFDVATGGATGKIARLLGADKIISGVIGRRFFNKKGYRIDLFIVDAKSGITLGAVTASTDLYNFSEVLKKLVLALVNKKYLLPQLKNVDAAFLKKEVALYEDIFFNWSKSTISERNLAVMAKAFAEILYLIEHKDDFKMYKVGVYLQSRILREKLPAQKKRELAEFINKLLKHIKYSKETSLALLLRAAAFTQASFRLDDAKSLARRHLIEHPEINPGYANFIIGKCFFIEKNYEKAIEFAEKGGRNNGANNLLIKIYRTLSNPENDKKELKCLKVLNVKRDSLGYNVVRRIQLTRKIEGSKAVLKYFNQLSSWTRVRPEILIEVAKANIALGRKKEAATIIYGIANERALSRSRLKNAKLKNILKKDIFKLRKELDSFVMPWKTFAEVLDIPDKYKFYIRPMGNPNSTLIRNSIPLIEEYLGCRVGILPRLPMPDDPACFKKGRGQYNSYRVQDRLKRLFICPKDAISIAEITEKDIYCQNLRFVYGSPYYGSYLISYRHWYGAGNEYVMTNMLAKSSCSAIMRNAHISSCSQTLCMQSSDGSANGNKYKKFKLCPKCFEALSKKNADGIAQSFHFRYNRKRKLADDDKQQWGDEYKQIVHKTLAEAEKIAEEEAKKTEKYLSVLTLDKEPTKGLFYKYYEFEPKSCNSTNDLDKLTVKEAGVANVFDLTKAKRKENYGLIFEGYIKIPFDGKYQFYLSSNDGSRLWIDDKEVIENDKMQAPTTKSAEVALKAGYHKIKLTYIQGGGGALLTLYWRGPKTLGQKIPANVLFHKE